MLKCCKRSNNIFGRKRKDYSVRAEMPVNIYLDLSKAFDTLDHEILLYKLKYYGLNATALQLLKSYLSKQTQYVEYNNINSDIGYATTGVPQGSILGPLFYYLYK